MRIVSTLRDLRSWCLSAKAGQQEDFSVGEEVAQETASSFAGEMNGEREGHVWLDVQGVADSPEPTTRIHIRCTH